MGVERLDSGLYVAGEEKGELGQFDIRYVDKEFDYGCEITMSFEVEDKGALDPIPGRTFGTKHWVLGQYPIGASLEDIRKETDRVVDDLAAYLRNVLFERHKMIRLALGGHMEEVKENA